MACKNDFMGGLKGLNCVAQSNLNFLFAAFFVNWNVHEDAFFLGADHVGR